MSATHVFSFKPQGAKLEEYILSQERRAFIMGPLGSGKTFGSGWKCYRTMCAQAPNQHGIRQTRGIAIRNTYPDLMGTTAKDWLEMFGDLGDMKESGYEPPTHHLAFRLPDGTTVNSEMVFMALDREAHIRKLRGVQATFAWLSEVKELPFGVVAMVDLRVGRYPREVPPTWFGIFGDTNAPDTDHWYYNKAEEERPKGYHFIKQPGGVMRANRDSPWVANPEAENLPNLPGGSAYYVDGAQGKSEDWVSVNLANQYGFVKTGKPVVPSYVDETHCKPFELVKEWGLTIGLDFGLTPAAIIGQVTPNGTRMYRSEVPMQNTGIGLFVAELKNHLATRYPGWVINKITGDPAGDQRQQSESEDLETTYQIMAKLGLHAEPAYTNDFTVRAEVVDAVMRRMIDGKPGFQIHPDCKVTRKGLQGGYYYRRIQVAGDERYTDEPVKNIYSHPCEALQYDMLGGNEGELLTQAVIPTDESKAYRKAMGYADDEDDDA